MDLSRIIKIEHKGRVVPRLLIYLIGNIVLALGLTINTRTGLGSSPNGAAQYTVSQILGVNLGIGSFLVYLICIFVQFLMLRKAFGPERLLQIVLSFVTSFFIGIFDVFIPVINSFPLKFIGLAFAIICIGTGSSLIVDMELTTNPADALAHLIGEKTGRGFGFGKNVFDFSAFIVTVVGGLLFEGKILCIGVGTICAMIFTGRVIALFQKLFKEKLRYFV